MILGNTDTYSNLGTTNSAISADSLRYINAAVRRRACRLAAAFR